MNLMEVACAHLDRWRPETFAVAQTFQTQERPESDWIQALDEIQTAIAPFVTEQEVTS